MHKVINLVCIKTIHWPKRWWFVILINIPQNNYAERHELIVSASSVRSTHVMTTPVVIARRWRGERVKWESDVTRASPPRGRSSKLRESVRRIHVCVARRETRERITKHFESARSWTIVLLHSFRAITLSVGERGSSIAIDCIYWVNISTSTT